MTATLSIGRAGLDSGVTIEDPQTQDIDGAAITWTGFLASTSLAGAKALRQQLLGYVNNPDELWVPVVCGWDPALTGFYRLTAVSVGALQGASYTTQSADLQYNFPYSVTVEQVPGYAKPVAESILLGALRTNVSSITATNMTAFVGMPAGGIAANGTFRLFPTETRTGEGGLFLNFFALANPTLPAIFQFDLDPADPATISSGWYQHAAKLESQSLDGATYRTVVGRQIPDRTTVAGPGHDWRLSNGFVRVAPAVTTGGINAGCDITVSHYDGTQYDTAVRYTFTLGGAAMAAAYNFGQVAVLRNDPAVVSVRLSASITNAAYQLDLTLRRGSRNVECRWSLDTAGVIIVARSSVEAATAITGGIRATSNDASGNRYVLAAAQTTTNDLTNGKITSGSVTAYDFMIGSEVTGSSATGQGTAQNQIYQWICAQSETYRLVGR